MEYELDTEQYPEEIRDSPEQMIQLDIENMGLELAIQTIMSLNDSKVELLEVKVKSEDI